MKTGQISCYKSGQFICSLHRRDRTVTTYYTWNYSAEREAASLSVSGQLVASASSTYLGSWFAGSQTIYTGDSLETVHEYCSWNTMFGCVDWNRDYSYNKNHQTTSYVYHEYGGSFGLVTDLLSVAGGSAIGELLNTGSLSFLMNMTGDATLTSAELILDVTRNTPLPDANRVPEPGSMALLGIGLAGLAWSVRRKKTL